MLGEDAALGEPAPALRAAGDDKVVDAGAEEGIADAAAAAGTDVGGAMLRDEPWQPVTNTTTSAPATAQPVALTNIALAV